MKRAGRLAVEEASSEAKEGAEGRTDAAAQELPLRIAFKGMDASPAIEARVKREATKLARFHHRVMGCQVTITAPHRHHHKGTLYAVAIQLTVPAGSLWINRSPSADHRHEDIKVAIRDAFDAAARRLEDRVRIRRGEVKRHIGEG